MSQALKGAHGGSVLDTAWSYISEEECAWILAGKPAAGRKFIQKPQGTVDNQNYTWVVEYDHAVISNYSGFSKNRSSKKNEYPLLNCTSNPQSQWNTGVTAVLENLLNGIPGISGATKAPDSVFIPTDTTAHSDIVFDDGTTYVSIHNKHNNIGGRWFALSGTRHSSGGSGSTPRGTFITNGLNSYSNALAAAGAPRQMAAFVAAFNRSDAVGKAIRMGVFKHLEARSDAQGGNSYFISTTNSAQSWQLANPNQGPVGTFGVTAANAHQLRMVARTTTMANIVLGTGSQAQTLFQLQVRGRANAIVYDHDEKLGGSLMENRIKRAVRKVLLEAEMDASEEDIEAMSDFILDTLDGSGGAEIQLEGAKRGKYNIQQNLDRIDEARWAKLAGLIKN